MMLCSLCCSARCRPSSPLLRFLMEQCGKGQSVPPLETFIAKSVRAWRKWVVARWFWYSSLLIHSWQIVHGTIPFWFPFSELLSCFGGSLVESPVVGGGDGVDPDLLTTSETADSGVFRLTYSLSPILTLGFSPVAVTPSVLSAFADFSGNGIDL